MLPTAELVGDSFEFAAQQLVFRFAIDAITKNCMRYNSDYLFGTNVVPITETNFHEKVLKTRATLS
jgi:hypothetical protein